MSDFPALPAPKTAGVTPLSIDKFLDALHGPAGAGIPAGQDPAAFGPTRRLAVDVRSPAEFEAGHIPGAVNIPLFSNAARAEVGTAFKEKGRYDAIRLGLVHTGPQFAVMLDALAQHGAKPGDTVLVYCWRGGMRSGSVAWFFALCGFNPQTLEGGYRSYRRWCKTMVGEAHAKPPAPVMILGGRTGVGKTAVLLELRALGEQMLDLEALCNHRGSAFGAMGQAPQPSNEVYENTLALAARSLDPSRRVWFEHEGSHVGKVMVPFGIHEWVKAAPGGAMVIMDMTKEDRVRRLVEDYCSEENVKADSWVEGLKTCISTGLSKKLGGQNVTEALRLLDEGKWEEVAGMLLGYYDKLYDRWIGQTESGNVVRVECPSADAVDNAKRVLQALAESEGISVAASPVGPTDGQAADCNHGNVQGVSGAIGEAVSSAIEGPRLSGTCFCGEVKVSVVGEPRSVSCCHCSICRRLSGAPFSCQALFAAEQVDVTLEPGAGLHTLRSSKVVERGRCASCMSPVRASLLGGKLVAVPLGMLTSWRGSGGQPTEEQVPTTESVLRPWHHLHYSDRVMDVRDGLPKYKGSAQRPVKKGPAELCPEEEW